MAQSSTSARSIGWRLELFSAFFIPLLVIAVALRFYARWLVGAKIPLEDALVIVSLASQLALAAVGIASVFHAGVGHHLKYLEEHDPQKVYTWGKYLVTLATLYFVVVNIPKLAVLALYRRLFPARAARLTIYVLAGILLTGSIVNVIISLAACSPFEANYNPAIPGAKCIDKEGFYVWTSIPNIVTDVVMLILPLPIVWDLHNATRMKIALTFTFLVGSFGLVTSILRFHTFFVTNSFTDGTYDAVELIIWTITEPGIYLISACLLTYRPLLERLSRSRIFGSFKGSLHSSQHKGYGHSHVKDGESGGRAIPLRDMSKMSMGFTELHDEESSGTAEINSSIADMGLPRQEGITVTTKIVNSWTSH